MPSEIVVGPILGFRGLKDSNWRTSALVVIKGAATKPHFKFKVGKEHLGEDKATLLKSFDGRHVWRFEWQVPQAEQEQQIAYSINEGETFHYVVPEREKPLRISYGSCFGFSSIGTMKKVAVKDERWQELKKQHRIKPYHLMLMGGDQVYADAMWEMVPPLKEWFDLSIKKRIKEPYTAEMRKQVEKFYFDLYCDRWSQAGPAAIMSQVPSLMMWDDHDIFDGWGSYPPEQQASPVFQGIWKEARDHFRLFQLQAKDDADLGDATLLGERGFTYAHRIGDVAVVALDMRSERTQEQVMSLETWNRIHEWMYAELPPVVDGNNVITRKGCLHLLVMSSIPVVYVNSNMLESAFGWLPGQQDLEDDFKDQWVSLTHQGERIRLIHRLLKFSKDSGCRATIVSGDVHVAALGYILSERDQAQHDEANVVNQLISSAMVHTPPSGIVLYMMEKVLADKIEEVDRGITARMSKFPGSAQHFIGARNWLSLTFDEKSRIWAEWYVEGQEQPYTKVVHAVGARSS